MKCSTCEASTRVLETRQIEEFIIWRRHRCQNGHISKSYQIPDAVFRRQKNYIMYAYQAAMRGVAAKRATHARHEAIKDRLRQGMKWVAIEEELKVSENTIRSVNKQMLAAAEDT